MRLPCKARIMKHLWGLPILLALSPMASGRKAMMQQELVAQEQLPYDMSLNGIESSLLFLSLGGATPELEPFLDQIDNLTAQMKAEIEESAHASQAKLDEAWNDFVACNLQENNLSNDLSGWNASHRSCRSTESDLYAAWQSCLSLCHVLNDTASSSCYMFELVDKYPELGDCNWQDTHETMTVLAYMEILRDDFELKLNEWTQKHATCVNDTEDAAACYSECSSDESSLSIQRSACDETQGNLESHACGDETGACQTYKTCYDEKKTAWQNMNATVATEEEAFTAEYRGALRIECLTTSFNKTVDGTSSDMSTEIEICRATDFGSDEYLGHIRISYYDISANPKLSCSGSGTAEDLVPGSAAWAEAYYSNLPSDTTYNTDCNATCCCPDTTTTATTTTTNPDYSCLTPVTDGCFTIGDEATCMQSIDGRDDGYYGESPCVWCGDGQCPSNASCETLAYFNENNNLQGSYHVASCSGEADDDPDKVCLTPVADGCYTISDSSTCTSSMDGRSGYYSHSECVWCDSGCPSGAMCEPLKVFSSNSNLDSSYAVASCNTNESEYPEELECLSSITGGCFTTNDENVCRANRDGRVGFYGNSPCVWCSSGCPSGAVCEPYKLFEVNDNFNSSYRQASCNYNASGANTRCLAAVLEGCFTISDYATCVSSIDGRAGTWGNSPCVWCGEGACPSSASCEPLRYFEFHGSYDDASYITASCPIDVTTTTTTTTSNCLESVAAGCYTLGEEVSCTNALDGRDDGYWGGYPCVWCPDGCPSSALCESYKWFEVNGLYSDNYTTASC